jgi:hypothetical protein
MEKALRQQIIEKVSTYWNSNQARQAGGTIFETIPVNHRHLWAYEILKLAYSHFPKDHRVDAVLEFAEHPEKWGEGRDSRHSREAHRIVDEVNDRYDDPIIFRLATQVGKIVYTAQQYHAPFDHSAGWEIAEILKQIVQQLNDREFEVQAWSTLANESFIELEKPVMCHPACPTCEMNGLTPRSKTTSQRYARKKKL